MFMQAESPAWRLSSVVSPTKAEAVSHSSLSSQGFLCAWHRQAFLCVCSVKGCLRLCVLYSAETHAWFFSLTSMVKLTKEAEAWNPWRKALGTEVRTQRLRWEGRGWAEWQFKWIRQRQVSCFVFTKLLVEPWEIAFWEKGIRRLEFE